jgi:outer membrane biosynthesis protein TonB
MISRTVVPADVRPPSPDEIRRPARRTTTYMDERTVVPPELSDGAVPLNGKTSIPDYLPLGVLVDRTLVPRGMPAKPIERAKNGDAPASIAVLDERVVVPAYVEPAIEEDWKELAKPFEMTSSLREVVEPDIFTTGDANLLVAAEPKRNLKTDTTVRIMSVILHIALVIFLISIPKIFPPHVPTQEELDLARKQLSFVYLPPEVSKPAPPTPRIRIDPRILNKVAPPVEKPRFVAPPEMQPKTQPERPTPELPASPTPHVAVKPPVEAKPAEKPAPSQLEPVTPAKPQPNRFNFNLPNQSLRDQLQDAINNRGSGPTYTAPGGGLPRGGGSGVRGPGMQPGVSILTPTEGVDFSSYIQRLLATVRRNWYAVMPESALMGEKGIVMITFHIKRDGSVPMPDPVLERTSGEEPLDGAAMSAIRTSSPFEPLPPQFKGPDIQLRFIFFYNLPVDYSH